MEYPARLEKLMGHWSWELQLSRSGYSIPHVIYAFIHRHSRSSGPVPLWDAVRAELWTLLVLSPFFKACLELPWWETAYAGDSSMPAFGIVETQATIEELREEGRWATVPGWVMAQVEQKYTLQEREVWRPVEPRVLYRGESDTETDDESDPQEEEEEVEHVKRRVFSPRVMKHSVKSSRFLRRLKKRPPPSMRR